MKCHKCGIGELEVIKMNGQNYAKCGHCGGLFSADDLRNTTPPIPPVPQPMRKEKKKGGCLTIVLGIVGTFFGLIFLLVIFSAFFGNSDESEKTSSQTEITPSASTSEAPFEVTIEPTVHEAIKGKPSFTVNTNLPDETELMLSLQNDENYRGQAKIIIKNGTATSEEFSNLGNPLSGKYILTVSMSLPEFQSDYVRSVIGEYGENITGPYVKSSAAFEDVNVIHADFDFDF